MNDPEHAFVVLDPGHLERVPVLIRPQEHRLARPGRVVERKRAVLDHVSDAIVALMPCFLADGRISILIGPFRLRNNVRHKCGVSKTCRRWLPGHLPAATRRWIASRAYSLLTPDSGTVNERVHVRPSAAQTHNRPDDAGLVGG